ncbi:MAG: tyrosine protein phosphatase [Pseudomonadota bacterium]
MDQAPPGELPASNALLVVCNLDAVPTEIEAYRPSHMISCINAAMMPATPPSIAPEHHLKLAFNDIVVPAPGLVDPKLEHVQAIVAFAQAWDARAPLLIHCWAGLSRSAAAALIVLAARHRDASTVQIVATFRAATDAAKPNARMVAYADTLFTRQPSLQSALAEQPPTRLTKFGPTYSVPDLIL